MSTINALDKIKWLVVHAAATPPDMDVTAEMINQWHIERGWDEIGYHFVIRRSGLIEIGRDLDETGAHVAGYNKNSWGVCMAGGVDKLNNPENNFEYEQFISLFQLLRALTRIAQKARIIGHNEVPGVNKACPCFDVGAYLPQDLRAFR